MNRLLKRLREEFLKVLPPTIFFFITLQLVALIRALMLRGTGIAPFSFLTVTVTALVLGKVVLIADLLPFVNRYPEKPLIFNVVWKTVIYIAVSVVVHYCERLYDYVRETGSLAEGQRKLLAEFDRPRFLAIQILLIVLVFSYSLVRELVRVLGRRRVLDILFADPAKVSAGFK